jgi:acylpyruvate hydrolase
MKLITFADTGADVARAAAWRCGVLMPNGTDVLDVASAYAVPGETARPAGPSAYLDWFDLEAPWFGRARRALEAASGDAARARAFREAGVIRALDDVQLLAPVPRPGKLLCVGLNYRDHAREAKLEVPGSPVVFAKFVTAVVGHGHPIVLPPTSAKVDYEAELGVVIGRRCRHVSVDDVSSVVAGYLNANDVSARDFQKVDGQWVRAKSCDSFAPMGPWLVSADEVGDPGGLDVRLRLNGEQMQASNTREFVFGIGALVAFITETITLEPGDVLLTGTPPGVGFARRPPVYLAHGDRVEVEITGLGVLENPVVDERRLAEAL